MTGPAVLGHADAGWGAVADAFARNFTEHGDVGAACSVYADGRMVVDLWGGLADRDAAREWAEDTLCITFSTTKGITAVVCNRLIEQGRLDPDAPVAEYWPEFVANGKGAITVGDVLSHRAALAHCEGTFTLDEVMAVEPVVRALAAQAPNWEPGPHGYHARTYGWLTGEIVRRVTGMSLGAWFAAELAAPLGLDFFVGLPEALEPRVARLYPPEADAALQVLIDQAMADPDTWMGKVMSGPAGLFRYDDMWNTRALHATEMPSSNGIGDARSLARLYAACVGEVATPSGGFRALADATVDRATTVRSEGTDLVLGMPTAFGLGFTGTVMLPPGAGPRAFGHAGAGGSLGFADRDAGIGFGYVMNQMQLGMTGDRRTATLVAAVYSARR
ncbi:MAG: serine hydrolase domain-containing protein [Acidimicrobiia bacterium]|jgi:CubicO group peptidase (beta-lactamase class C family)